MRAEIRETIRASNWKKEQMQRKFPLKTQLNLNLPLKERLNLVVRIIN